MIKINLMLLVLAGSILNAGTDNKDPLRMFPKPQDGYERYIVELPKNNIEENHRVELIIGKNIMADCNTRSLTGNIVSKTVQGWGYSYIEVSDIKIGPSTMMACPEPTKEKFISIKDKLRRYNSRLPIVIYTPKGYSVKYRIWSADTKTEEATIKGTPNRSYDNLVK